MLAIEVKKKLSLIAVFAAPLLLVKTTGFLMSPHSASADATAEPIPVVGVAIHAPTVEWNDDEQAVAEYIGVLDEKPFGPTPMYYRPAGRVRTPTHDEQVPVIDSSGLQVTLIMESSSGNRALINGAVVAVGDFLDEGRWQVLKINAHDRSVKVQNVQSSETFVVRVPK